MPRSRLAIEALEERNLLSPASGLYIGDASDDTVKLFNENSGASLGTFVTSGSGGLHGPRGLLFDPAGNLLLSNQNVNLPIPGAILRFDGSTGAFDNAPVPSTDPNAPFAPRGIILGPSNTLYVADIVAPDNISDGKIEVYQYDPSTGTAVFQKDITHPAGFSGQFHPRGILFGPDGNLYVSVRNIPDPTGGAVLEFDPTGNFLGVFVASDVHNDLNRPEGLVFGPDGNLYVTSFRKDPNLANDTDKIEIFSGPNNPAPGSFLGEIDLDHQGMARAFGQALLFGPGGNLFVPITAGDPSFVGEVREYDVSTKTFTVFVPPASAGGPLGQPWYLTFAETNPTTLAYGEEDAPATRQVSSGLERAPAPSRQDDASLAIIATLGASQVDSQQAKIASFGHSHVLVVSPPSPAKEATSFPQGTVHFGTPRNDGLHHLAASHRPAASTTAWEAIDRVFADFDN